MSDFKAIFLQQTNFRFILQYDLILDHINIEPNLVKITTAFNTECMIFHLSYLLRYLHFFSTLSLADDDFCRYIVWKKAFDDFSKIVSS